MNTIVSVNVLPEEKTKHAMNIFASVNVLLGKTCREHYRFCKFLALKNMP